MAVRDLLLLPPARPKKHHPFYEYKERMMLFLYVDIYFHDNDDKLELELHRYHLTLVYFTQ
ncbi:hypothetical protein GOP56_20810 [Brevibacillus sp. 7WMA2]|uniref:hypothetical protein n=1 Tax=Brevibacillus TaxID=55080 RepID=UPI0013A7164A|nr:MULTISPECIES: hypothetical protein [Brevibacillus]MCR8994301.1 hypothetical protein [Brevibacillus laterosporus]QIC07796.1 hypothetical protein GOP56_20810 [Brevibacillus sp. 7WMA2]WPS88777.1 hypothetical protein SMD22_07440 [Brevibacillus halotolerans]